MIDSQVKIFDSPDDRALILEEAKGDPVFARKLEKTFSLPDAEKKIAMSARKAVVNEFNPSLYPETRGLWKKLRATVQDLVRFTGETVRGSDFKDQIRRQAVRNLSGLGDLGQWEIIGSIVGAVAGAASNIYTSNLQADTAKKIQQMQIDAQMQQIQVQQNIAKLQAAEAAQQAAVSPVSNVAKNVQSAVSNVTETLSQSVGGVPLWAILIGLFFFAEKA